MPTRAAEREYVIASRGFRAEASKNSLVAESPATSAACSKSCFACRFSLLHAAAGSVLEGGGHGRPAFGVKCGLAAIGVETRRSSRHDSIQFEAILIVDPPLALPRRLQPRKSGR